MLEFILKYWLEFLLGLIVAGMSFVAKKFYSLYLSEKSNQKTKEQEEFYRTIREAVKESALESKRDDEILQRQIDILKSGILSIQRRNFKQECRDLLDENHEMTLAEFESIQEEHETYHALGGNGSGDALFGMVEKKAQNTFGI